MTPTREGSLRLFRFAGIDVYVHWSWAVIALLQINRSTGPDRDVVWATIEYLGLFVIVLLHEFGHSLACRQTGGVSDQIVLWPLGGVAYVDPPPRPGAHLWSIAAGPLVNVVLGVLLYAGLFVPPVQQLMEASPGFDGWYGTMLWLNTALLVFNLLPVYPLDGGQMLRSVLWFFLGAARSLRVATFIGLIGAAGLIAYALWRMSMWTLVMAGFIAMNCWQAFKASKRMRQIEQMPRHAGYSCPTCHAAPLEGTYWGCPACQAPYDPFATGAKCLTCGTTHEHVPCPECRRVHPYVDWMRPVNR